MHSHSSHQSHEGYPQSSPGSYHSPLPDSRRSLSNLDSYFQHLPVPVPQDDARREELVTRSNSASSSRSDSARTHATTGSSVGYPSRSQLAMTALPPLPSTTGAGLKRPSLEFVPGGLTPVATSGGTASSGGSSGAGNSLFTTMSGLSSISTMPSPPAQPKEKPKPFVLARPGLGERKYSDDSLLQPSQFLGARVTNATPMDEKERMDFSGGAGEKAPILPNAHVAATA